MSDRPTPLTDAIEDTAARNPPIWKHARDLERKLDDHVEALAIATRSADDQMFQKREAEAKLAEAREALERIVEINQRGNRAIEADIAEEALARIDANTTGKDAP